MNYKNIDFNLLEKVNNFSLFIHLDENKYSLYTNSIELNEVFELEKENLPQLPSYSKILKRKKHTISNLKEKLKKFTNKESLKVHREDVLSNIKVDEIDFYKPLNMKKFSLIDLIDELDNIWLEIKINKIKYDIENELEMLANMHNILDLLVNNKIEYLLKKNIPNDIIKQVFTTKIENIFFTKAYENIKKLMELFNKEKPYFTKIKIYGEKEEIDKAIKKIEKYFIDEAVEFAEESSIKSRFELFFTYDEVKNFCYLPLETKTLKKDLDIGDKYALFLDEEKQCFINKENKSGEEIDFDLKYIHNLQIKYDSSKKEEFKDLLQRILLYNVKKRLEEGNDIKVYNINFDFEEYLSNINFLKSKNILYSLEEKHKFNELLNYIIREIKERNGILANTDCSNIIQYNLKEEMENLKKDIIIIVINCDSIEISNYMSIFKNILNNPSLGINIIFFCKKNIIKTINDIPILTLSYKVSFFIKDKNKINLPHLINKLINDVKLILDSKNLSKKDFFRVPIGVDYYKNEIEFSLGYETDSYNAIIVGEVGSGKTSLINNLIVRGRLKYREDEIKFILMDYKPGSIEFRRFENIPNCVIYDDSMDENFELSNAMLLQIQNLIKERGELLSQYNLVSIDEYNIFAKKRVPHVIIIIDEFQRLLTYSTSNFKFSNIIDDIARIGRAYGIHLILSTQSLRNVNIKSSTLGQIKTRIAFKVSSSEDLGKSFHYTNNNAPLYLKRYQCIYNDNGGIDENRNIIVNTFKPFSKEEINSLFKERK